MENIVNLVGSSRLQVTFSAMKKPARTIDFSSLRNPLALVEVGRVNPSLREAMKRVWPSSVTGIVVLTGERRAHYLLRHPESTFLENHLIRLVRFPDEVYLNRHDLSMAIFYLYFEESYWLRAAIWVSEDVSKQNSIFSLRYAKEDELARDRAQRRLVWQKR